MSAESTDLSPQAVPTKRTEARILLHLPDLAATPAPQPLPAALSRSAQARTRGMEVLQRVLDRRVGLFSGVFSGLTGPNRWQNRLWLATFGLIGVSCLMLVMGMRQSSTGRHSAVAADPALVEEFENELGAGEGVGEGEVRHVVAYHTTTDENETARGAIIQPVAYEAAKADVPRGAWLEGTIIPEESAE